MHTIYIVQLACLLSFYSWPTIKMMQWGSDLFSGGEACLGTSAGGRVSPFGPQWLVEETKNSCSSLNNISLMVVPRMKSSDGLGSCPELCNVETMYNSLFRCSARHLSEMTLKARSHTVCVAWLCSWSSVVQDNWAKSYILNLYYVEYSMHTWKWFSRFIPNNVVL